MSILSKVNIAFVIDPLALLGCGIASGATIALAIRLWPTPRPAVKAETTDPLPLETKPQWPEATMPIQTFDTLLDSTGTASFIDQARQGCGLNEATWSNFILPVVRNVAELVQLLPASPSQAAYGFILARPFATPSACVKAPSCHRDAMPRINPTIVIAGRRASSSRPCCMMPARPSRICASVCTAPIIGAVHGTP